MTASESTGAGTPRRKSRWLGWVLAASLVVNMLLVGLVVGHRWERWRAGPLAPSERIIERVVHGLPEPARQAMRDSLEQRRPQFQAAVGGLREARTAVREALKAEPFDADRFAQALAQVRQRLGTLQAIMEEAAVEAAAKLPPETRHKLAERRGRGPL